MYLHPMIYLDIFSSQKNRDPHDPYLLHKHHNHCHSHCDVCCSVRLVIQMILMYQLNYLILQCNFQHHISSTLNCMLKSDAYPYLV